MKKQSAQDNIEDGNYVSQKKNYYFSATLVVRSWVRTHMGHAITKGWGNYCRVFVNWSNAKYLIFFVPILLQFYTELMQRKNVKYELQGSSGGGGGQVVRVLNFNSDNLSLNPPEAYSFYSVKLFEKNENELKKWLGMTH